MNLKDKAKLWAKYCLKGLIFVGKNGKNRALNSWQHFKGWPKFAGISKKSLRFRLCIYFSLFLITAWLIAALLAWKECREYVDEFFDSQQMLFAKTLSSMDFTQAKGRLPYTKQILPKDSKHFSGDLEDDALAFAVFATNGQAVLTDGQKGQAFYFEPHRRGFFDTSLKSGDEWRILWLDAADGKYVIGVGQEIDYRRKMALEVLGEQILPWLMLIPVLLLGLYILLSRELAPLREIALQLQSRTPEDNKQLDLSKIPAEVLPLASGLNGFFSRINAMLSRERAFISDAAHELKTPLAGLRVQAQVATQPGLDSETRNVALAFLRQGIDRCSRLVEQLLAISRLESLGGAEGLSAANGTFSAVPIKLALLLEEVINEYQIKIKSRDLNIKSQITSIDATICGDPGLVFMLVRNLFENAVSYTPFKGNIVVTLENKALIIENECTNLSDEYIARLGERFFRPPGQEELGSGLGLSIVKKIVNLHGFSLKISIEKNNLAFAEESFKIVLAW